MNQSKISVMQPGDKFKLCITYQVDIYLDTQLRVVMHHLFGFQLLRVHMNVFLAFCCVCVYVTEHTDVHCMSVRERKNLLKLHCCL